VRYTMLDVPVGATPPRNLIQTTRIDVLDGWRAISVALVVLSHLIGESALNIYFSPDFRGIALNYGQIGVEFFFAISGFVICSGLIREEASAGSVSLRGFYIRRAFRILPPLWIYLSVVSALSIARIVVVTPADFLSVITFTCNLPLPAPDHCSWPVGHTWSLAYEEQFYIVFPLLFILLGQKRRNAMTLIGVAMAVSLLLLYWTRAPSGVAGLRHFFSITCGVLAAMYREQLIVMLRKVPWPVFGLLAMVPFATQLAPWSSRLTWFSYLVGVGPAITIAMIGTTVSTKFRFLAWAPLTAVGRASYGIYLWQQLFTSDFGIASPLLYFGGIALMGVIVLVLYRTIEKPLIAAGRRLSQKQLVNPVLA